jgi:hypothetical protein
MENAMFFVYADCKPDGTPFYIGKGNLHRVNDKRKRNNHHTNICAKYPDWYRGIAFMGNEKEAFAKEIELIAKYRNVVVNQTAGGQGTSGLPKDNEWKAKLANSAKNQWAKDGMKEKMAESIKTSHARPEVKEKMSQIAKSRNAVQSALAPHICIECGRVSNSRGINYHQKSTNHVGKEKL